MGEIKVDSDSPKMSLSRVLPGRNGQNVSFSGRKECCNNLTQPMTVSVIPAATRVAVCWLPGRG